MIVKYDNIDWHHTDTHWHVSLTAIYGPYEASSGTIKVKINYGSNPLQSGITIAQNVARKRLRKQMEAEEGEWRIIEPKRMIGGDNENKSD